jgi:hypothetical protein
MSTRDPRAKYKQASLKVSNLIKLSHEKTPGKATKDQNLIWMRFCSKMSSQIFRKVKKRLSSNLRISWRLLLLTQVLNLIKHQPRLRWEHPCQLHQNKSSTSRSHCRLLKCNTLQTVFTHRTPIKCTPTVLLSLLLLPKPGSLLPTPTNKIRMPG